jgi:hypothetical protein
MFRVEAHGEDPREAPQKPVTTFPVNAPTVERALHHAQTLVRQWNRDEEVSRAAGMAPRNPLIRFVASNGVVSAV